MTTIIGIQKKDRCMIVADSRTTDEKGRPYSHPDMKKISQVGEYLVAGSGDADACDLIQYTWEAPKVPEGAELYKFMITEVAPSIKKCLKDAGYETGIHYPRAIHQNAAYESTKRVSNLEVSEQLAESLLSLPMDEFMTEKEVEEIATIVKRNLV